MTFRDHFSKQASLYSAFRPTYPPELFEYLAGLAPARRRAWDCATGSGQAAVALSRHFDEVIATDASAEQIAHAKPSPRVSYAVAGAEASGIDPGSVDLVAVAQALHWFDLGEFYAECGRVLVRSGIIAAWGYGDPVMDDPALEAIVHAFNRGTIEAYWTSNRDILLDGYKKLEFPFREAMPPAFQMGVCWTLEQLTGYFRTWSATNRFIAEHGRDPVDEVQAELSGKWGGPGVEHRVVWPLHLRVGFAA